MFVSAFFICPLFTPRPRAGFLYLPVPRGPICLSLPPPAESFSLFSVYFFFFILFSFPYFCFCIFLFVPLLPLACPRAGFLYLLPVPRDPICLSLPPPAESFSSFSVWFFCFFVLFSFLYFCLRIFCLFPLPPLSARSFALPPRPPFRAAQSLAPSDKPTRVSLCSLFASCTCFVPLCRFSCLTFCLSVSHSLCLTRRYASCVVCEGSGQVRVRGQACRGGDRGRVPLGYFKKYCITQTVCLVCKKIFTPMQWHTIRTHPMPFTPLYWSGARHECHDLLRTCVICQSNVKCFVMTTCVVTLHMCVVVVVCELCDQNSWC